MLLFDTSMIVIRGNLKRKFVGITVDEIFGLQVSQQRTVMRSPKVKPIIWLVTILIGALGQQKLLKSTC